MKRKLVLFLVVAVTGLLTFGCAEEEKEVYVPSFEAMGCSATFSDISLFRNPTSSGNPNTVVASMNCNSSTAVSIAFYDTTYGGHREVFLVNGQNEELVVGLTPYQAQAFTFSVKKDTIAAGSYYAKYRVIALNVDTNEYTYQDYNIEALDNYGRVAPETSVLKTVPEVNTDSLQPLRNNEETAKEINAQLDEAAKNLDSSAVAK